LIEGLGVHYWNSGAHDETRGDETRGDGTLLHGDGTLLHGDGTLLHGAFFFFPFLVSRRYTCGRVWTT